MKDLLVRIAILSGPVLLGVFICLSGIFLSLGFKKTSAACFLCALGMLGLLRFVGWFAGKRKK